MNALKILILSLGLLTLQPSLHAQLSISWETLEDVTYDKKKKAGKDFDWSKPQFGDDLKALEGERVKISGYMLPITADQKRFILSRYHFSECFFCGNGGPETVIELKLEKAVKKVIIDHPVTFEGKLKLNAKAYELVFVLEDAELKKR